MPFLLFIAAIWQKFALPTCLIKRGFLFHPDTILEPEMKRLLLLIFIAAVIIFSSVFFLSSSIANAESAYVQSLVASVTVDDVKVGNLAIDDTFPQH